MLSILRNSFENIYRLKVTLQLIKSKCTTILSMDYNAFLYRKPTFKSQLCSRTIPSEIFFRSTNTGVINKRRLNFNFPLPNETSKDKIAKFESK